MQLFLELIANAAGFKAELNSSKNVVTRFVGGARQELASLRQSFGSVHGQLVSLGLTVGAVKTVMDSARLDRSLTMVSQTAGEGTGKVAALRTELFRMAKESGREVENLKGGVDALIQSGMTLKQTMATVPAINVAMAVTDASAESLASGLTVGATFFDFDLSKPEAALEMLDKMTVAGRRGNAELENLSAIFSRVGGNAKSGGLGFDQTLGFIEGLSLVEKNPERLATLADSTLRVFTNMRYMAAAQKSTGVKFFDSQGERRDALAVLTDIRAKYATLRSDQEKGTFIQKAFGAADLDTIKGIRTLLDGSSLEKISGIVADIGNAGGTLNKDYDAAINNLIDQSGRLKNSLREAADSFAKPIKDTLSSLIGFSLDKKEKGGLGLSGKELIGGGAGLALGTLLAARYGNKAIGGLASRFLKGGASVGAGIAEGKVIEAATGVQPVFVTNWPAGGLGAGLADTAGAAAAGGGLANAGALAKKSLKWLAGLGPAALALGGESMGSIAMLGTGAAVGAGAMAVGAGAAGYGAGSLGWKYGLEGTAFADKLGEVLARAAGLFGNDEAKRAIEINLSIDQQGRVVADSNELETRVAKTELKRGAF